MRKFKKVPYKFLQLIIKSDTQMTSLSVSANNLAAPHKLLHHKCQIRYSYPYQMLDLHISFISHLVPSQFITKLIKPGIFSNS